MKKECKKMGRPTDNPRDKRIGLRLSEKELDLLQHLADTTGQTRVDTIVSALEMMSKSVDIGG